MSLPKVIIVGGGFGGLHAATYLKNTAVSITLIDKTNHHLFQPLLYQVASSVLAPRDIAFPIRGIFKNQENCEVIMDEVISISTEQKKVFCLSDRILDYDYLIIATGTRHSYFGHDEWEQFAPGLKTLKDSIEMRKKILIAFEQAEASHDLNDINHLLTFVVVGGGPTGVELSGAIGEIAQKTLYKNFKNINPSLSDIFLVEAGPRILPSFPENLAKIAHGNLEEMGVHVLTNAPVTHIDHEGLKIGDKTIKTPNVFWAAGNQASPFLKTLKVPLDRNNRVLVTPFLHLTNNPSVFVIGDAAHTLDEKGMALPGVAQVAIQQGKYVAQFIQKSLKNKKNPPFKYSDKGSLATIGKSKAIAVIWGKEFSGLFAWIIWSFVHILFLIGFRTRIIVMFEWLFWYVTGQRSSRILYDPYKKE
jgi:NADH:ubiquinone reductase (H+-translocating)